MSNKNNDVVIVGAGPAGLLAAFRLKSQHKNLDIHLIEKREDYRRPNFVNINSQTLRRDIAHICLSIIKELDTGATIDPYQKLALVAAKKLIIGSSADAKNPISPYSVQIKDLERVLSYHVTRHLGITPHKGTTKISPSGEVVISGPNSSTTLSPKLVINATGQNADKFFDATLTDKTTKPKECGQLFKLQATDVPHGHIIAIYGNYEKTNCTAAGPIETKNKAIEPGKIIAHLPVDEAFKEQFPNIDLSNLSNQQKQDIANHIAKQHNIKNFSIRHRSKGKEAKAKLDFQVAPVDIKPVSRSLHNKCCQTDVVTIGDGAISPLYAIGSGIAQADFIASKLASSIDANCAIDVANLEKSMWIMYGMFLCNYAKHHYSAESPIDVFCRNAYVAAYMMSSYTGDNNNPYSTIGRDNQADLECLYELIGRMALYPAIPIQDSKQEKDNLEGLFAFFKRCLLGQEKTTTLTIAEEARKTLDFIYQNKAQEVVDIKQKPTIAGVQYVVEDKQYVVEDKQYVVEDKQYVVEDKQYVVEDKQYVVEHKRPVVTNKEPMPQQARKASAPDNVLVNKKQTIQSQPSNNRHTKKDSAHHNNIKKPKANVSPNQTKRRPHNLGQRPEAPDQLFVNKKLLHQKPSNQSGAVKSAQKTQIHSKKPCADIQGLIKKSHKQLPFVAHAPLPTKALGGFRRKIALAKRLSAKQAPHSL